MLPDLTPFNHSRLPQGPAEQPPCSPSYAVDFEQRNKVVSAAVLSQEKRQYGKSVVAAPMRKAQGLRSSSEVLGTPKRGSKCCDCKALQSLQAKIDRPAGLSEASVESRMSAWISPESIHLMYWYPPSFLLSSLVRSKSTGLGLKPGSDVTS